MLIVLSLLLSITSTAYTQNQNITPYRFTSQEIKEFAYVIESRKLLILDTADYKEQIRNYELKFSTLEEVNERLKDKNLRSSEYINALEQDVNGLSNERTILIKEIEKLEKKNHRLKILIPISFGVGAVITLLLL